MDVEAETAQLTEEVQNKIKKTNLERYGYENPWQDKSYIFKQYWSKILSWHDYVIPLFSEEDFKGKSFEYIPSEMKFPDGPGVEHASSWDEI